jgi:hypothetical protein
MSTPTRAAALVALILIVAACGNAASSGPPTGSTAPSKPPSGAPTGAPSSTPGAFGAIEHPTGATDVVLRYDETGGFAPMEWSASSAPIFTLYGDGAIIFRNLSGEPPPAVGSVRPFLPFRTARMSEEQIQTLLEFALGVGGLGTARPNYPNDMVADASSAVFTVNAGGLAKTVSVYGLGIEGEGVPDIPSRRAFAALRDRLVDIDKAGSIRTDIYAPDRYRAILLDGQPGAPDQRAWPWRQFQASDFVVDTGPNAFPLPARVLTVADVEVLAIAPYEGGFIGMPLGGPGNGKIYSLSLRPLLPDDKK